MLPTSSLGSQRAPCKYIHMPWLTGRCLWRPRYTETAPLNAIGFLVAFLPLRRVPRKWCTETDMKASVHCYRDRYTAPKPPSIRRSLTQLYTGLPLLVRKTMPFSLDEWERVGSALRCHVWAVVADQLKALVTARYREAVRCNLH
jgi:hypothetical protein